MTSPPPRPTEEELHAYIDNELQPSRRAEVADALREDPTLAARVAAYEADRERLRRALGGIAGEPVPPVWAARIEAAMSDRPTVFRTRRYALAASVALTAAIGAGVVGWRWAGTGQTIVAEAEAARDGRLEGRIAGGEPLPPPQARDAMLRSALGMRVRAPDLERFGFRLAAMEFFTRSAGGAAQLRYAAQDQRALTIYVRPSDGTVQFDILQRGGVRVCVWQDDVVGAVIIAAVSAGEMLRIASSAYTDLNL